MVMKPRNGIVKALSEPLHASQRQRYAHLHDAAGAAPAALRQSHRAGPRHGHDLHLGWPPKPEIDVVDPKSYNSTILHLFYNIYKYIFALRQHPRNTHKRKKINN